MPVDLSFIHAANKTLVQSRPLVAIFFGGNSGIGHYTIRELCRVTAENGGKSFRAYIVGRNSETAAEVIAQCRGIYLEAQINFVPAGDLSLIQDVDRICAEIVQLVRGHEGPEAAIDYLMMSHAGPIFLPRKGENSQTTWLGLSDALFRYEGRPRRDYVADVLFTHANNPEAASFASQISAFRHHHLRVRCR